MSKNVAKKARFTLDFPGRKIVGTTAGFAKASKGSGDAYDELVALMNKHPDFGFEVKKPEEPAKPKQSYKGMDIDFIQDYLKAVNDTATLKKVTDNIAFAEKEKMSKYPLVKRKFFEEYKNFDYSEAKKVVKEYRDKLLDAKVVEFAKRAEKKSASTEEKTVPIEDNKGDLASAAGF